MKTLAYFGFCLSLALAPVERCLADADAQSPAISGFDLLIINGTVVDGTGADAFRADVGIAADRISAMGALKKSTAAVTIDATGLIIAPGFIDVHSHADRALAADKGADIEGFLRQGVTTSVYGVDGFGTVEALRRYRELGAAGLMGTNAMAYVGHNSVRRAVMGNDQRPPDAAELEAMLALVREAMEYGAIGLSSGLMYLPGRYAQTAELVELAQAIAPYGGIYDSHIRDPARALLESHKECLDIALAAGVRAHPAHLKAVGGLNFGRGPDLVHLVQSRIAAGQEITIDVYPYDGAATRLVAKLLHPADDAEGRALADRLAAPASRTPGAPSADPILIDARKYWSAIRSDAQLMEEGRRNTEEPLPGVFSWIESVGYDSLRIVVSSEAKYEGRMVSELAREAGVTPFRLLVDLLLDDPTSMVTLGAIMEEEVRLLMQQPWAMIASDGEEVNVAHPRGRGTFARVLGHYVREARVLTLEEAVHKISGLPAGFLRLGERGVIREGSIADITVFDPDLIIDKATWEQPALYAEGVNHVLIGGKFALRDGELTSERLGQFIPASGGAGKSGH